MNGKRARRWRLVLVPLLLAASGVFVLRWLSVPAPRRQSKAHPRRAGERPHHPVAAAALS